MELTHLTPGDSVGFTSFVAINYAKEVVGTVARVEGFAPLNIDNDADSFQTASGGVISLSLGRNGASPGPIDLLNTTLEGNLHANGQSIRFRLQATANVTEPNSEITLLSGNAAVSQLPVDGGYRLRLRNHRRQNGVQAGVCRSGHIRGGTSNLWPRSMFLVPTPGVPSSSSVRAPSSPLG